jgi:predicted ArsR family transcriptional regulator
MSPQFDAMGMLSEPLRRALYDHLVAEGNEVSRDSAAAALRIKRSLAAFHLDKLVESGLAEVSYRRLSGRTGPGAGRPTKLYRRSHRQLDISLPPRRYELAANILAEAIAEAGGRRPVPGSVAHVALRVGEKLGRDLRSEVRARAGPKRRVAMMKDCLDSLGYETTKANGDIVLRNCPFHALAERHRPLICNMNLSLINGILKGFDEPVLGARPNPVPTQCCVIVSSEGRGI